MTSPWNDKTTARLHVLWDEGLPTAEIGRRLAVPKNAVVGKARRLGLPARPSPIKTDRPWRRGSGPRKAPINNIEFIATVERIAKARGLSVTAFGVVCGIPHGTISNIRAGRYDVGRRTHRRLLDAMAPPASK